VQAAAPAQAGEQLEVGTAAQAAAPAQAGEQIEVYILQRRALLGALGNCRRNGLPIAFQS
jgi:hypothetical protein